MTKPHNIVSLTVTPGEDFKVTVRTDKCGELIMMGSDAIPCFVTIADLIIDAYENAYEGYLN